MSLCRRGFALGVVLAVTHATAPAGAGQVSLVFREGRVTLDASDATAEQILSEWARVGQTRIVSSDGLPEDRVTLHLSSTTETLALDVILRSASGYVAVARRAGNPGLSLYDRILVLPVSTMTSAISPSPVPVPVPPEARAILDFLVPPGQNRDEEAER